MQSLSAAYTPVINTAFSAGYKLGRLRHFYPKFVFLHTAHCTAHSVYFWSKFKMIIASTQQLDTIIIIYVAKIMGEKFNIELRSQYFAY